MRVARRYANTMLTTAVLTTALGVGLAMHLARPRPGSQPVQLTVVTVAGVTTSGALAGNTNSGGDTFAISATTVTGLYPGATRSLVLTLSNPYSFDIKVTDLSATLTGTSSAGCPASSANLVVGRYQGPPALPLTIAGSTIKPAGAIPLSMPRTVFNACQGVTFTLRLTGTATKVNS
jgi:hypothetical protein